MIDRLLPLRRAAAVAALLVLSALPAAAQDASELLVRTNRLEGQVRQLSGQIEQLQFQNQRLQEQFRKYQEDVEFRFQELKGGGKPPATAGGAATPPAGAPRPATAPVQGTNPQKRSDVFDPASQPTAPGAPRTVGTVPGDVVAGVPAARGVPMDGIFAEDEDGGPGPLDLSTRSRTGGGVGLPPPGLPSGNTLPQGALPQGNPVIAAPPPAPVAPRAPVAGTAPAPIVTGSAPTRVAVAGTGVPKDDYDLAYGLVQQRQYEQAEMAFRQFLQTYPRDRMVPNATYWLGETYFRRGKYPDAVEQYLKVYKTYGQSKVAPDSLFKLGLALRGMGQPEQSCATLAEVVRKYPDASGDLRAGVEREQKRGNC